MESEWDWQRCARKNLKEKINLIRHSYGIENITFIYETNFAELNEFNN